MLTPSKKSSLITSLKNYKKEFIKPELSELDESGTRLMINSFLTNVLGFKPIEEIKTEYMIKGTYADYVVQFEGSRHFLVEVKAYSIQLSEKHLRQTVNYGANEGIDWALLTNGHQFEFYKIIFNQPIEEKLIFSIDLSDENIDIKQAVESIQYLHKDSISKEGLKNLWNKCEALDPSTIASIIYSQDVIAHIKKFLKKRFKEKCSEDDIVKSLNLLLSGKVDPATVKPSRSLRKKKNSDSEPMSGDVHQAETK